LQFGIIKFFSPEANDMFLQLFSSLKSNEVTLSANALYLEQNLTLLSAQKFIMLKLSEG